MNIDTINNKIYNVALYMRLSKEDGDKEESESITNQRKILQAYLKENKNFKFYKEYIDDGISGTTFNREHFKEMLKDIEDGKVNMVVTKNLARLGRDYIETGRYIESYFPEHNIRYVALLDDVDTMLDKNCETVAFKNIMNDYYAKETSRNVKKTKNRKKKEGFYYITVAPFGYKKVDKSGKLEIVREHAEIVRKIFNLFLEGYGTFQIACWLNENKILPPGLQMKMQNVLRNVTETTDKWTHTAVKRILTNQVYVGRCVQNKTKKISYKSKKLISLSPEEYTIIENHHEAIIDIDTFNLVQEILNTHKNNNVKRCKDEPLLKQFLYCSHCHNKLLVVKKQDKYKDKITERKYIYCPTATRKISNRKCFPQYLNYNTLEKVVLKKISEVFEKYLNSEAFNDRKALERLIKSNTEKESLDSRREKLNQELKVVNEKIKVLYEDKLNNVIEEQDYAIFSESLISKRHELENLIEEIDKEITSFDNNLLNEEMRSEMKCLLKKVVSNNDFTKSILEQLIKKIEIDKDKNILIHFKFYELHCFGGYINAKEAIS